MALHRGGVSCATPTDDRHLAGVVVTARAEYGLPLPRGVAAEARALLDAKVRAMEKTAAAGPPRPCWCATWRRSRPPCRTTPPGSVTCR
ncbi:hypothetical protein [Streptomyces chrestomyceticus]|uniref:hypothetical protein n=1 Tax=Streptomyces chrestomyceticus TaxID=68185 RepID=UPI0019D04BD5|nr:hypothetical protein [Streptomyces chrestomyceticus]